jgi:hypothetical protein
MRHKKFCRNGQSGVKMTHVECIPGNPQNNMAVGCTSFTLSTDIVTSRTTVSPMSLTLMVT